MRVRACVRVRRAYLEAVVRQNIDQGEVPVQAAVLHRRPYCKVAVLYRRPYCTGGRIAQAAVLHRWPYCTGGRTAQVAVLHESGAHATHAVRTQVCVACARRVRGMCGARPPCQSCMRSVRACKGCMQTLRARKACAKHACAHALHTRAWCVCEDGLDAVQATPWPYCTGGRIAQRRASNAVRAPPCAPATLCVQGVQVAHTSTACVSECKTCKTACSCACVRACNACVRASVRPSMRACARASA